MSEDTRKPVYSIGGLLWQIPFAGTIIYWFCGWPDHLPEPGYAVTFLGLAAVIMAVRANRFTRTEEIAWIVLAVAMCFVEIRAIRHDHDVAANKEAAARQQEETNFQNIAAGIQSSITESDRNFSATMGRIDKTLTASESTLKNTLPRASLEFRSLESKEPFVLVASKTYEIYLNFTNAGNDFAREWANYYKTYLVQGSTDTNIKTAERRMDADFAQWSKSQHLPIRQALPVRPNGNDFVMAGLGPFTEDQVKQISEGRIIVYVFLRFTWKDRAGDWVSDECFRLSNLAVALKIAYPCNVHNTRRYKVQ